jgi:DNA-binding transcriptional regulator GbsR (MarR family)
MIDRYRIVRNFKDYFRGKSVTGMDSEETDSASDSTPPLAGDKATLSQFIENMGLHFEEYGVPRIGGRILGLLLVSSRPVSSEEMSEVLDASRSSVSTNLRTLLMSGLADRVSLPGERSDHYVFSDEAWEAVLEIRLEQVETLREMARDGLRGLQDHNPARARLVEIAAWADMLEKAYKSTIQDWQSRKEEAD